MKRSVLSMLLVLVLVAFAAGFLQPCPVMAAAAKKESCCPNSQQTQPNQCPRQSEDCTLACPFTVFEKATTVVMSAATALPVPAVISELPQPAPAIAFSASESESPAFMDSSGLYLRIRVLLI